MAIESAKRHLLRFFIRGALVVAVLDISACTPRVYHSPATTIPTAPEFHIGGGVIALKIEDDSLHVSRDAISNWVQTAAHAVTLYLGRFPVKHVDVVIQPGEDQHNAIGGVTYEGRRIVIAMSPTVRVSDLESDWVLTHEMFHLAFPQLPDDAVWMNEGLSTYLEPIAQAQNGTLKVDAMWLGMVQGMPSGLPEAGDRGLDNTHTWGRTYWGGTLFWLMADVQIRQQTHGAKSLVDVIRGILDAGGDGSVDWEEPQVFSFGDRITGTHVLNDLHDQLGRKPGTVDLAALWKSLGIAVNGDQITFDDHAPLADIRRAITTPR